MAFTAGVTRATGDTVLASDWNNYTGANGSIDFLNSTPGPLTYADFTTAAAPAAPGAGKVRLYAATGDLLGIRVGAAGAAQVVESQANKNAASGYAGLDAGTLLTGTQVPNTHGASGVQTHHAQSHAVDSGSDHSAGTQGDILYAGAAGAWARLGAGTSGYFLKTQGAGANPTWAAVTAGISVYARNTTPASIAGSTTETTLFSTTITGNDLSTNKMLRITLRGDFLNNSGGNRNTTLRLKFGAMTMTAAFNTNATSATRRTWKFETTLANIGATNVQHAFTEAWLDAAGTGTPSKIVQTMDTGAIDTTANVTLALTAQNSDVDATLETKFLEAIIELV